MDTDSVTGDKKKALALFFEQLKEHKKAARTTTQAEHNASAAEPVAIIGLHGYLPGNTDVAGFWSCLDEDKAVITEIPPERFKWEEYYDETGKDPHKMRTKWGGFIGDIDRFDPSFFGILPKEAELIDPQQRLLLMSAWKTIEDSGYAPDKLKQSRTGVFVAVEENEYLRNIHESGVDLGVNAFNHHPNMIANRLSYFFDFHGPSEMVNTMCSGAAVAIHRAIGAIRTGEINMALIGAARILLRPEPLVALSQMNMISTTDFVRSFGKDADGYVRSEGVASMMLKPLSKAVRDQDHIYALIRNSAINYNGRGGMSMAAPNKDSHTRVIKECYEGAGIDPRRVGYIEAQGMGNQVGDIVEWEACNTALEQLCRKKDLPYTPEFCRISTLKPMIGHMECASAMGAVFKIIHSFKTDKIHRILNFRAVNPHLDLNNQPCRLLTETEKWERGDDPRLAGLHSYGSGGNNAHLLLEEYIDEFGIENSELGITTTLVIIPLSAKHKERLKALVNNLLEYLDGEETPDLNEIAYTLQTGRDAMEERLAFIVADVEELKEKLKHYLAGNISDLCTGTLKNKEQQSHFILDGEAGEAYIKVAIAKKEHRKIAQMWTFGMPIDWDLLYERKPRRVALPTYPFAREICWLRASDQINDGVVFSDKDHNVLHPLVDHNISTLESQCFIKTLTGNEFYLNDHVMKGEKMLPGVVYLEMARAAGTLSAKKEIKIVKDVVWLHPFKAANHPQAVKISIYPDHEALGYEIVSAGSDDEKKPVLHSQGRLIFKNKTLNTPPEVLNITAIYKRITDTKVKASLYKNFNENGYNYGAGFQTIEELYIGKNEALSHVILPTAVRADFSSYVLHPAILDGALQTTAGLTINDSPDDIYLPFSLEKLTIYESLPEACYAYATYSKNNKPDSNLKKYDVLISDREGRILLSMKGFTVRSLGGTKPSEKDENESDALLYFESVWQPGKTAPEKIMNIEGPVLLFDATDALQISLQKELADNQNVILIKKGEKYKSSSKGHYEINPEKSAHYQKLITSFIEKDIFPAHIIYTASTGKAANTRDFYSLLYLSQALLSQKLKQTIALYYVHHLSASPQQLAITGLARTIGLENPHLIFHIIGIQSGNKTFLAKSLYTEMKMGEKISQAIRYRSGKRMLQGWNEVKMNNVVNKEGLSIKKQGVYLITGGLGGLGLIFARHLAENDQPKLVLTGRSALNKEKQESIESLKALGSEVIYIRGDVSRKDDVKNLIAAIKNTYKTLNGIIHCAGVSKTNLVVKKTAAAVKEVLAPKVSGTIHLDEFTKDEPLDFFMMFSSIASVTGHTAQADYAYANSFLDHFAIRRERLRDQHKRAGKSITINWPLWQEGGMEVNKASVQLMKATTGLDALSLDEGLSVFEQCLNSPPVRMIVMKGNPQKIRRFLRLSAQDETVKTTSASNVEPSTLKIPGELRDLLAKDVSGLISSISKIDLADINIEDDMSAYGFDSITFTDLSNRINAKYGTSLTPALFFEHPTISAFIDYLVSAYSDRLRSHYKTHSLKEEGNIIPEENNIAEAPIPVRNKPRFSFSSKTPSNITAVKQEPIAIIGMSGILPQSKDLDVFWEHLEAGDDLITEIPKDRWDWQYYYGDPARARDKTLAKWGGFMPEADTFDADFFNISPREAELMDPQHRLFLQTVWKTIEDAGYKPSALSNSQTGLFVGVSSSDYIDLLRAGGELTEAYSATGIAHSTLANRISYLLNLHGPSEPVDTACSSSLIAIHRAVRSIQSGDCDMVIAGGVNALLSPTLTLSFSKAGMLSPDGRCKTFDASANGYVRGEGAGAVLLKPLSKAEADGDHIYGTIRGSGANHGGHVNTLTTPNPNAQAALLVKTYDQAEIPINTISYIEAHGTGTGLGDPVEVNGLKKAFKALYHKQGKHLPEKPHCGIGSVKTYIGHLEAGAGIAGVLKVLLALKHKKLPGNLHFKTQNPYIDLENSPFYIVDKHRSWPVIQDDEGNDIPRRAGVSSFGFGGANAHIILEEYINKFEIPNTGYQIPDTFIIPLSAKNEERLQEMAENLLNHLENTKVQNLEGIAYTLQTGREAMEERVIFIVENKNDLKEKLRSYRNGKADFKSHIKKENIDFLLDGGAGEAYINYAITHREINSLARLWVKGVEIDWNLLYEAKPERIALPTYPFARERHWVTINPEQEIIQAKHVNESIEKPGVDEKEEDILMYYRPVWKQEPLEGKTYESSGTLLLCYDDENQIDHLKESLATAITSLKLILVKRGNNYKQVDGANYTIDYRKPSDYLTLLKSLQEKNPDPVAVICISPQMPFFKDGLSMNEIDTLLYKGLMSVFEWSKALLKLNIKEVKLSYICPEDGALPALDHMITAFARSIRLENPGYMFKAIGMENKQLKPSFLSKIIVPELHNIHPGKPHIRYNNKGRWVKDYALSDDNYFEPDQLKLRREGTYILTGGAGGIGLKIARYLAEKAQANLILTGRSVLNPEKEQAIEQLEAIGSKVLYLQADVSKLSTLQKAIKKSKERFGEIHGVIHAAGIIKDAYARKKSSSDFMAVLTPKVHGTINLDKVTLKEPLDFFISFSSLSAVLGNLGQSDYASANAFMDDYMLFRDEKRKAKQRSGKSIAINWPLWEDGGMHMSDKEKELMKTTTGMVPVTVAEGIHIFEKALQHKRTQLVAVKGDFSKINKLMSSDAVDEKDHQIIIDQGDHEKLKARLQEEIKTLVRTILKRKATDPVDENTNLGEYNFDSITFMDLANHLNEKYKLALSPAIFYAENTVMKLVNHLLNNYSSEMGRYCKIHTKESAIELAGNTTPAIALKAQSVKAENEENTPYKNDPIAIIGRSGIMPQSPDLETFWSNLEASKDLITEIPAARWDWRLYSGDPAVDGTKTNSRWGGFIPDVDKFDAAFFAISPKEAELMDPQHRLFLQEVWKTIENAGYRASYFSGKQVGVFVGVQFQEYWNIISKHASEIYAQAVTGNSHSILANRISYLLNLRGPSEAIDTACSSALVAIHRAIKSIETGESEYAIAGGVSLALAPETYVGTGQMGILSPDGKCKTFDADANGYVKGEGIGAVLLKSLSKAKRDGDHIYGIIRGSAENHGGRANSLTAPNPEAQANLIVSAFKKGAVDPSTITYIETHGTGTSLGDPVEIEGLKQAFTKISADRGKTLEKHHYCGLGSVKTNIGHLEPAAGIAGIFKVLLAMQHKKIPASIHFRKQNPYIKLDNSPFYIVDKTIPWNTIKDENGKELPRRAGVSSFGFGGSNAHVILEEYIDKLRINPDSYRDDEFRINDAVIIPLSAKNEERLKEMAVNLLNHLDKTADQHLQSIAYTLQTGREAMETRLAFIVSDKDSLKRKLRSYVKDPDRADNHYKNNIRKKNDADQLLPDGKSGEAYVKTAIKTKELPELAKHWMSGAAIDWDLLYDEKPGRAPLPGYPFAKKRYWVPFAESKPDSLDVSSQDSVKNREELSEKMPFVLEKKWKKKEITAHQDGKLKGNCLVLVNADTKQLLHTDFFNVVEGKVVIAAAEDISEDFIKYIDLKNDESAKQAADTILNELKTITCFIDLSDIYKKNKNYDGDILSKIAFYQELIKSFSKLSILYFTKGLQYFKCKNMSLSGAKLAGLIKMLSAEYPHVKAKCIDIDQSLYKNSPELQNIIQKEYYAELEETELCYRENERYAPYLQEHALPETITGRELNKQFPVTPDGVYVISGGTGGIGLEIAKYLAGRGAKKLVLMGISPLPPQEEWKLTAENKNTASTVKAKITHLLALKREGVQLAVYTGSLMEKDKLRLFFDQIVKEWGMIRGVVHSAAAVQDVTKDVKDDGFAFIQKTPEAIRHVLAPKIQGIEIFHELSKTHPLDFFISFSSIAGQIPVFMKGMSDYGMANAYLDYFTNYQVSMGNTCFRSLGWAGWTDVGRMTAINAESREMVQNNLNKTGLYLNTGDQGLELFEKAMVSRYENHNLLPCLLNEAAFTNKKKWLLFAKIKNENEQYQNIISRLKNGEKPGTALFKAIKKLNIKTLSDKQVEILYDYLIDHNNGQHLAAADPGEALKSAAKQVAASDTLATIKTHIIKQLQHVLKLEEGDIDVDDDFQDYGLDSIAGIQLATSLERVLHMEIPPFWLIRNPSVELLAEKILEEKDNVM